MSWQQWSPAEASMWANENGMAKLADTLLANGFGGEELGQLDDAALTDMGFQSRMMKTVWLKKIKALTHGDKAKPRTKVASPKQRIDGKLVADRASVGSGPS